MIAAADLRARKLIRSWHEGVAIVRELADKLQGAGTPDQVPDLAHVAIDPSGAVEILKGSPPAKHPVQRLAATLEALIAGTSPPPELLALTSDNTGDTPKHASIGEFADVLAMFERPGRQGDIARVATRAAESDAAPVVEEATPAESPSDIDSEISQLRDRARQARKERSARDGTVQRRRQWTVPIFIGGGLLLVVYLGLATAVWLQKGQHGPEALASVKDWMSTSQSFWADLARTVARTPGLREVPVLRDALPDEKPSEAASAGSAAPPETPEAGSRARGGRPASAASGPQRAAGGDAPPGSDAPPPTDADAHVAPDVAEAEPEARVGADHVVYTSADPSVVPPTMVRKYLPSSPKARTVSATGMFDIVVSQTGEVESVRLISIDHPFHEKMLVEAAKAWRFVPAQKDGQPVKYRVAVRITM